MQRILFSVPVLSTMEHQMKTQRHFENESETVRREVAQIRTMIVDLDQLVQILASDIATEEERSRVFNRSDPAYSMLARTLAARRDNLKVTIAALEERLENVLVALSEAIAA
jgi:septation ring formation regulator EzrA